MSLVKGEYWGAETDVDAFAVPTTVPSIAVAGRPSLSQYGLEVLRSAARCIRGAVTRVMPNSIASRLFLGSIAAPVFAFSALVPFGDLLRTQVMLMTFAGATLIGLTLTAVVIRQTLRPFSDLAVAAKRLGTEGSLERLPESGPCEASVVAKAFNTISERVSRQVEERIRLLTAFSHDMQTPITRMRLRVELAEHFPEREKLLRDLREAERLVRDGIAYAKNSHITSEHETPVDLRAFIESIVFDYRDTGRDVSVNGAIQGVRNVKPAALRRILSNFIDNALKFAGAAEIAVRINAAGETVVAVMDRGPGIAPDKFDTVMEPFVKLQHRSTDQTTGVGLGLAIARQLACEMNASLLLENRLGGGLSAQIVLANNKADEA